MVKNNRIVKSKKHFLKDGNEIVNYIKNNSSQNAEKYKNELRRQLILIKENPKIFPSEYYLPTKNNLYRFAIVMKHWKIIYKVTNKQLIFLGIIHTARHPKEIKKLRTNNYK